MKALIFLAITVIPQIFLSRTAPRWSDLIIPAIFLIYSVIGIFNFVVLPGTEY